MKYLAVIMILISSNSFALSDYELDQIDQDFKMNQVEQRLDDMEYQNQLQDNNKFYDDLHKSINKTGWE